MTNDIEAAYEPDQLEWGKTEAVSAKLRVMPLIETASGEPRARILIEDTSDDPGGADWLVRGETFLKSSTMQGDGDTRCEECIRAILCVKTWAESVLTGVEPGLG